MKEKKFRAWIEEQQYMAIQGSPDLETLSSFMHHYSDAKNLMEFTGLKDVKGKEIFEGDIVKWGMFKNSREHFHRYAKVSVNPDIQFEILYYISSETNEKIESDGYVFHYGRFAYKDTENHLEIIGNIYENKELI